MYKKLLLGIIRISSNHNFTLHPKSIIWIIIITRHNFCKVRCCIRSNRKRALASVHLNGHRHNHVPILNRSQKAKWKQEQRTKEIANWKWWNKLKKEIHASRKCKTICTHKEAATKGIWFFISKLAPFLPIGSGRWWLQHVSFELTAIATDSFLLCIGLSPSATSTMYGTL